MGDFKYAVHLRVGYCDVDFVFDDGNEALAFAEGLLEHMVCKADDDDKKAITIVIKDTKEDK